MDWTHVINLDDYKSIETYWIALYMNSDNATYFDSFWVECIPKKVKNSISLHKSNYIINYY